MMETMGLQVCLTPAPEIRHSGHKIRTVICRNPDWYQRMVAARKSSGSLRQRTIRALGRILDGMKHPYGLEEEILEEIEYDVQMENF